MTRSALTALIACLSMGCAVGDRITLKHDDVARNYYLVVPEDLPQGAPLVLALHGGGPAGASKGRRVGAFTGLAERAVTDGFAAAFPSSQSGNWNDGRDLAEAYVTADTDDVGFLLAVIDDVAERAGIDPDRVVVSGISNGGFMTQRMLCEHPDRFVAGVSFIATMATTLECVPDPSVPVAVRFVLGTEDPLVPYEGGMVAEGDRGEAMSADAVVNFWAQHNGCADAPELQVLPDLDPDDGSTASVETQQDCDGPVSRVILDGAGHTWPGGTQYLPERVIGSVNHDVQGDALLLDFAAPLWD